MQCMRLLHLNVNKKDGDLSPHHGQQPFIWGERWLVE